MLNRLSCALFGEVEQENASSSAPEARGNAAGPPTQGNQGAKFNTTEEEMGWLLVDVSRSSTPSLPDAQDQVGPLRQPDGTAFEGVLNLSPSPSSSDSEDAEGDISASDLDVEDNLSDAKGDPCHSEGTETDIELLGELPSSQCSYSSESSGEFLVDMSSSCSSLSVISEFSGKENDPVRSAVQNPLTVPPEEKARLAKKNARDMFLESWMMMPPPRFTGTEVNSQLKSSPFENQWIENASVYTKILTRYGMVPPVPRLSCVDIAKLLPKLVAMPEAREQQKAEALKPCGYSVEPSAHPPFLSTDRCEFAEQRKVLGAVEMRQLGVQQRQQAVAARKFLTRSSLESSNKARMALSYSRKQVPARNRLLRPSGGKCGRFGQRHQ